MTNFEYKKFLEAVDRVCLNCLKCSEENCEHCPVRFTCDELGKEMKKKEPESWYVIASCEDPESWCTDFYRWDTGYDEYELDMYEELIPHADKKQTLEYAEDRAKDVLSCIWSKEVYIVLVHESEGGYMDSAEFVKKVSRKK